MTARAMAYLSCAFLFAISASSCLNAQSSATDSAQSADFTIHSDTRAVLTDVTVTDRSGMPVTGLKNSDFELFDNGKPQSVSSFEEHLEPSTQPQDSFPVKSDAGVYSNDFMLHLPPVLNIVLIDVQSYTFSELGFVWYKVNRFIKRLPANEPIAIYVRASDTIMLQSFTSDHALLLAAARRAVNRFSLVNLDSQSISQAMTMHAIASDIGQLPGRKNVLWFTGNAGLRLLADGSLYQNQPDMKRVYDELESARVAVYPIDAGGVEPFTGFNASSSRINLNYSMHADTNDQLDEIAKATGGHAFYNNNGLDAIAAKVVSSDGDYYTLSYSPSGVRFDGTWHKVEIKLKNRASNFHLSYRQGYFADAIGGPPGGGKDQALSGLKIVSGAIVQAEAKSWSTPLIFTVTALPVTAMDSNQLPSKDVLPFAIEKQKKGSVPYVIRYALPANQATVTTANGMANVEIGVSLVAVNHYGDVVARASHLVTLSRREDDLHSDPEKPIWVEQRVNLPKGENDLYCTTWDMNGHRLGSVQTPIKVTEK